MGIARMIWTQVFAFLKPAWKMRCGPKLPPHKVDVVSAPRVARMAGQQTE